MTRRASDDWFTCPVCGEEVPIQALACPSCGSDDRTGWSEETAYDGVDLPDPEGDAPEAEAGDGKAAGPSRLLLAALLLAGLLVLGIVLGLL